MKQAPAQGASASSSVVVPQTLQQQPLLIVTRPAAQAADWVSALQELGCLAQALPLITILPAPDPTAVVAAWSRLHRWQALMFVSAAAVQGCFAHQPPGVAWPPGLLAACTGGGTSAALRQAGVPPDLIVEPAADSAQFDSEALWPVLHARLQRLGPAGAVLVVRGGEGRDWLSQTLAEQGYPVSHLQAYARSMPSLSGVEAALLKTALAAPTEHIWIFSSSLALTHLSQLAPQAAWGRSQAWATHPRIGRAAEALGFSAVQIVRQGVLAVAQQRALLTRMAPGTGPYNPRSCE